MSQRVLVESALLPGRLVAIRRGDTLSKLLIEVHGPGVLATGDTLRAAIAQVQADNAWIDDPDRIFEGDAVFLRNSLSDAKPLTTPVRTDVAQARHLYRGTGRVERAVVHELAGLARLGLASGSNGVGVLSGVLERTEKDLRTVLDAYNAYRNGDYSYDHFYRKIRSPAMKQIDSRLTAIGRQAMGGRRAREVFRMSPGLSKAPSANFSRQMKALVRGAKRAKVGAGVLAVADAPFVACEIRSKGIQSEKDRAFVAGVTTIATGALFIAFAPAPVGLLAILGVAIAASVVAKGSGYVAAAGYDLTRHQYKIEGLWGATKLAERACHPVLLAE